MILVIAVGVGVCACGAIIKINIREEYFFVR
jgi:hypothetical protein